MSEQILTVNDLTKRFGDKVILNNVSFSVATGHIVGLVGPNGAGKTTIMKSILGLFKTDNGSIKIGGLPVTSTDHQALEAVGALIEYPGIYPFLSGIDHLKLFANDTTSDSQITYIVDRLKMTNYIGRKAKSYSLGMKQKLGIAMALINHPHFVILDEPMNGLDPQANRDLRDLIIELAGTGTTFLISSHILSELEKLVDDLVVINRGKIVAQGSMDSFEATGTVTISIDTNNNLAAKALLGSFGYEIIDAAAEGPVQISLDAGANLNDILEVLIKNRIQVIQAIQDHQDLESSLLNLLRE